MTTVQNETTPHPEGASKEGGWTPGPWEAEADRICAAMVKRAPDAIRRASEALYEQMLYDVQDYLRENVEFNLSSELASAKHRAKCAEAESAALRSALDSQEGAMILLQLGIRAGDPQSELLLRVSDALRNCRAALSRAQGDRT